MTLSLRGCTALPEDQSWVPTAYTRRLPETCNSSYGGSEALLRSPQALALKSTYPPPHIYILHLKIRRTGTGEMAVKL